MEWSGPRIHGAVVIKRGELVECADLPGRPAQLRAKLLQECGEANVRAFVMRFAGVSGLRIDPFGSGPAYHVGFALGGLACVGTVVTGQACDDPDHFDLSCRTPVAPW